ncbi:hypothetical protein DRJ48_04880 [Candidatus Woesearchaeota archaeon]|nr:hypothetical protein [Candidatus Woesearchaeota archaeon]RLE41788.1 MAG: hypothetical protein DRJ48_04880 [Candidatus Woesearchaeota archaeon]
MSLSAPFGQEFRFCNGRTAGNLWEFLAILKTLSSEQFRHHVNKERNDFYNWVLHSLKERRLALRLRHLKSKHQIVAELSMFLENCRL